MNRVLCLLLALLASGLGLPTVDPRVWEDTENGKIGSFSVHLHERAELQAPSLSSDRTLRGWQILRELQQVARTSQKPLIRFLKAHPDVTRISSFYISNFVIVDGRREVVELLARREEVKAINSNRPFKVPLEIADDFLYKPNDETNNEWNIEYVKAPEVWSTYGTTGEGIYASADTGIDYTHPALLPNYRGNRNGTIVHDYSWWDGVKIPALPGSGRCGINSPQPCDDNSHGTHVMGTSVGQGGIGVAPGAKWIGCRNMDRGFGTVESYLSCLQFFLAPTDLKGDNPDPSIRPLAVGNSYGCVSAEGCSGEEFEEAVENLRAAGVFMSVSAGNSGPSCNTISDPPATESSVVSVGATAYQSDSIAAYSSRGPVGTAKKPTIVAPGSSVRSSVPGGSYSSLSGTSMASPHVGGYVPLITAVCPSLAYDVKALEEVLIATARRLYTTQGCGGDTPSTTPNNVFGHGMMDLAACARYCKARGY